MWPGSSPWSASPSRPPGDDGYRQAHNALAVLADGGVREVYRKCRLPNYAVFDEQRYFAPGDEPKTIEVAEARVGLTICEDVWVEGPPASVEAGEGARLIANPSGSPYHRGKGREREEMFAERARAYGAHLAFCNLVGGQDELVFDGHSFVVDPDGEVARPGRPVRGGAPLLRRPVLGRRRSLREPLEDSAEVYGALVLGLRDYVGKNGFRHVGIALSGGIDSALVALLAADALGAENVSCVVMPSPHSSAETQDDARAIAANLGAELIEIPIEATMGSYEEALACRVRERRRRPRAAAPRPDAARRARPRRREHPGPDPGQHDDGALQRARLAGSDDRQQERDVGRLRDPLRRHGRRLRGDQGRPEDARLRARPPPQRARPGRSWSPPR